MPGMNGILTTRKLRQEYPHIHVLVLTTYDEDEWIFDALRAGAEGYLLKDLPPKQLFAAIKGTTRGMSYIDPKITGKVIDQASLAPKSRDDTQKFDLNEREIDVLMLIAQGFSNADIAERLFLSEGTVRNYTRGIFSKLGVTTRTQAAVAAIKFGFVDLTDL